ncbi:uncharacterized protein TRIADDRAFT_52345 [Trichoplax adhaerens]|uniref:Uncharacterized protein n=1 Tax=Trichoplax adhaerens TaxID=10228 RepID=B3RI14_TRIAD|nr:hypothetical protein TRIADDRAFT_52345 [Trichoplax adhaerens]EDV28956.1 hypothetical protein TRIADDRAFT_52345 [Trichoplax adhaerens]|eukprot:XP_002108158.1 hypothetical protein TRIADDRAFT_52345 [Trichoplax adhaerens]
MEERRDVGSDEKAYNTEEKNDVILLPFIPRKGAAYKTENTNSLKPSDEAIDQKSQKKVKKVNMIPPLDLLIDLERKILHNLKDRKNDTLIDDLVRCCALTRIIHGDDSYELAENYVRLAHVYLQLKGLVQQSIMHAQRANDIIVRGKQLGLNFNDDRKSVLPLTIGIYYVLGVAYLRRNRYL